MMGGCCPLQIANSGVDLIVSTSSSSDSQTVTVSPAGGGGGGTNPVSPGGGGPSAAGSPAKRARLGVESGGHKMEFDRRVASLSQWLDQTEGLLELVASDSADQQLGKLTTEEQLVLIEVSLEFTDDEFLTVIIIVVVLNYAVLFGTV